MVFRFDEDGVESRMLANDPSIASVHVRTSGSDDYLRRAVSALAASTHIVQLHLSFSPLTVVSTAAPPLAEWIQSSATLKQLRLCGLDFSHRRIIRRVWPLIVHAVCSRVVATHDRRHRCPLQSLSLSCLTINAQDVVALLENSMVQELSVEKCTIRTGSFSSPDIAQRQVAQAFGANSTITNLTLGYTIDSAVYFCAILDALQSNITVERLTIQKWTLCHIPMPAVVIESISNLLRLSIGSIINFSLVGFDGSDNWFDPIARSMQNSQTIQSLEFTNCVFHSSACHQLRSIFSHGSTTSRLALSGSIEFFGNRMLTDIIQASPTLRELSLVFDRRSYSEMERFQAILDGLASESCNVERLLLGSLRDVIWPAFFHAIGSFHKVRYVSFDISCNLGVSTRKDLLMAFRRNGTLLDSNVTGGGLKASDLALLHAYHQRNRQLSALIHSKADLLKFADSRDLGCLLPSLLHVSMNGAPCTARRYLFDALLRCGGGIGPSWRRGKRSSGMQ
jgi:hypothetical protein